MGTDERARGSVGANKLAPAAPARSHASGHQSPLTTHNASNASAARLRRTIFALCRERGISTELRHELQRSVTGKSSLTEMAVRELRAVIERLAGQAVWTPQGMLAKLAGELENGRARLRAFCWKRFGKEPEQLDPRETRSAIAFLKNVETADASAGPPRAGGRGTGPAAPEKRA